MNEQDNDAESEEGDDAMMKKAIAASLRESGSATPACPSASASASRVVFKDDLEDEEDDDIEDDNDDIEEDGDFEDAGVSSSADSD